MSIKPLVCTIMAAQFIITAMLSCGTVGAMEDLGPTNLQKITAVLKENQEIQRQEQEKRKNDVELAKALLKDCDKISDAGERAACEKKYQSLVKSSIRACGAECQ